MVFVITQTRNLGSRASCGMADNFSLDMVNLRWNLSKASSK